MIWVFMEKGQTKAKLSIFGPALTSRFPQMIAEIEKNEHFCGKTSAVKLFKNVKIKALSSLFFREKCAYLLRYLGYFCQEIGRDHKSKR